MCEMKSLGGDFFCVVGKNEKFFVVLSRFDFLLFLVCFWTNSIEMDVTTQDTKKRVRKRKSTSGAGMYCYFELMWLVMAMNERCDCRNRSNSTYSHSD